MRPLHAGVLIALLDDPDHAFDPEQLSTLFGYAYQPPAPKPAPSARGVAPSQGRAWAEGVPSAPASAERSWAPVPFLRLEAVHPFEIPPPPEPLDPSVRALNHSKPQLSRMERPAAAPRWSEAALARAAYPFLGRLKASGPLDVAQIARRLSRAEPLTDWPRQRQRRPVPRLHLILEASPRLAPWWADLRALGQWLARWAPAEALDVHWTAEPEALSLETVPGARTLIVGDLATCGGDRARMWRRFALARRALGEEVIAWSLGGALPSALRGAFDGVWAPALGASGAKDRLLPLATLLVDVDADLVRRLRSVLPRATPLDELEAWTSGAFEVPFGANTSWRPSERGVYHARLIETVRADADFGEILLGAVREILAYRVGGMLDGRQHYWGGEEVFAWEVAQWEKLAEDLPGPWGARLRHEIERPLAGRTPSARTRGEAFWRGLRGAVLTDDVQATGLTLQSVRVFVEGMTALDPEVVARGPDALRDLSAELEGRRREGRTLTLVSGPTGLSWRGEGEGSPVTELHHGGTRLRFEPRDRFDPAPFRPGAELGVRPSWVPKEDLEATPPWAQASGRDAYGRWADVQVGPVTFRMRWIPPGTFKMGSPEEEEGRNDWEGPLHAVTLTEGYWLADSPCTEGLWEALEALKEGREASVDGGELPKTGVSWNRVQALLTGLETAVPELQFRLPTEAEWEYACRAGTETATYAGNLQSGSGLGRSDILEDIAWYDENSDGKPPVRQKRPNPWGLYDMLGNAYEWCADGQRAYDRSAVSDPTGPDREGTARVFRGGSWRTRARLCRAAFRNADGPSDAFDSLGFRLAGGQAAPSQKGLGPEAHALGGEPPRPPGGDGRSPSGAVPPSAGLTLITDRAELLLGRIERPSWAQGMGRDPYGLFADVVVPGRKKSLYEAQFRMRWISPGTFMMGSPDEEAGRSDLEGPQHEVTLTEGFWLADAPCEQALWEAVTGASPSRFQTPDRPVERVSFHDVQAFLEALAQQTGLLLRLPTEAEWEYACRAGTDTATYGGALEILGDRNAPGLDPLAWYGGNSGHGFELADGADASGWRDKQYPHTKAGTRPVRIRRPNPWGLFDTLGNVYEWCADDMRTYHSDPVRDPVGPTSEGTPRVFRGGSWRTRARSCRAAYRGAYGPSDAYDVLGFRLARGQAALSPGPEAESGDGRSPSGAVPDPRATAEAGSRPSVLQRVRRGLGFGPKEAP